MIDTYEHIGDVKQALTEIKDGLPEIEGRDGKLLPKGGTFVSFVVLDTPALTLNAITYPPFRHPDIRKYVGWVIEKSFEYAGDQTPGRIGGYCGTIGRKGQIFDYLHPDDVPYRTVATVVDSECSVNPSTRVAKLLLSDGENDDPSYYSETPCNELPDRLLRAQYPEGALVGFAKHQFHAEQTLPEGAAKLAVITTYRCD
jgi:hypothetical protein